MSEMVERVAREIYEKIHNGPIPVSWNSVKQFGIEAVWLDLARAAIEAMREPTDAMIVAAHETVPRPGATIYGHGWEAMIDEALK